MESPGKGVNVQISGQAAAFIKSKRLGNPVVLVNVNFRSSGGQGCGDSCGGGSGGSGCDEGKSGPNQAYINLILVDGGQPGADFVKVETAAGIPVYLAKRIYEQALQGGNTLIVTVKGLVMKKMSLEGLDLNSLNR